MMEIYYLLTIQLLSLAELHSTGAKQNEIQYLFYKNLF